MRDKKSLFEQVAAIIFGLSLVAGVGFLFFAACAHAFIGSTAPYRANTSMYRSLGLAVPLLDLSCSRSRVMASEVPLSTLSFSSEGFWALRFGWCLRTGCDPA